MEGLKQRIQAAAGNRKAELVLKNGKIVNVFTESVEQADLAIDQGKIVGIGTYEGEKEVDLQGAYVCPGFIDGHIHLESSMVSPAEFQKAVLPHGTTAVITDPHEIANVAGMAGIRYMMDTAAELEMDVYFMMPSCVPATSLDESGGILRAEDLAPLMDCGRVLGLAEMMNSFGTIGCDEEVLAKLKEALIRGRLIDGHAPMLTGKDLNAYVTAGVMSDHECSGEEEAMEKLARGQWIMIREGTAAKNMDKLAKLFEAPYYQRAMLVTDDKHPGDLVHGGHMDELIRLAVRHGCDPIRAVKMGSFHTAQYFGLRARGAAAPGYWADLVVVEDLKDFRVKQVYKDGKLAAEGGRLLRQPQGSAELTDEMKKRVFHSVNLTEIQPEQLQFKKTGTQIRVIDLVDKELITRERTAPWKEVPGCAPGVDTEQDIVKLAVLERHCGTGHIGLGFLGNYGLKRGAVATSVGHDSHNLLIAGTNDEDMILAGNQVIRDEGGLAIAADGRVLSHLPLKIAGIMSELPLEEVDRRLEEMKHQLKELGISEEIDGFMTLAFVSLPVIPELRLNSYGVIDVNSQKAVEAIL